MCLKGAGKFGKLILIIMNILFMLFGLALLIVGIIMRVDNGDLLTSEVIATLNEIKIGGALYLGYLLQALSILSIVIGGAIVIVSLVGLLGACMEKRFLLVIYAVIVGTIITAQIVSIALWFALDTEIENSIKDEMRSVLLTYEGIHSTRDASVGWDLMFLGLDCCGVDPVSSSNNDNEFENSRWWNGRTDTNDKVPESCCRGANKNNYKTRGADVACQQTLTDHHSDGCYNSFENVLDKFKIPIIVFLILLIVVEIIGFAFAIVLCCAIKEKNMIF